MAKRDADSLARFLAVAGLATALIGLFFQYRDSREKSRDRELQLANLLYEIRQLTVGAPGAAWLDLEPFSFPSNGETAEGLRQKTQTALLLEPNDVDALCYRGVYFLRLGKTDKSLDYFKRALAIDRNSAQVHRLLSTAYQRRDRLKEAEGHAQQAIKLDPDDPGGYNALGKVLSKRKDWDRALFQYRVAVEKDPTYYPAYNNMGYTLLLHKDDAAGAIEAFQRAVHFNPNSALSYTNWGLALEMQKKLDAAIVQYRKATEVDPGYANGYVALATALFDQGKKEEAFEKYMVARQLSPHIRNRKLEALDLGKASIASMATSDTTVNPSEVSGDLDTDVP